jgi:CBS domain containing-hemolysin-like protein
MIGDKFAWNDIDFEVIDMDRHRVDKLLVKRQPPPRGEEDDLLD